MLTIIPVDKIDYAPWNYKSEDVDMQNSLTANLARIGQVEIVQVREKEDGRYEMTNGNHRMTSIRHLHGKNVVAFNHGPITAEQAQRLTIETHISFEADRTKLARLVSDLAQSADLDELLLTMPYQREDIDRMIELNRMSIVDEIVQDQEDEEKEPQPVYLTFELSEQQTAKWEAHRSQFQTPFLAFFSLLP